MEEKKEYNKQYIYIPIEAKEQGHTILSALVYCQASPSLQQESESQPPLPHGEAPDLLRRPKTMNKRNEIVAKCRLRDKMLNNNKFFFFTHPSI